MPDKHMYRLTVLGEEATPPLELTITASRPIDNDLLSVAGLLLDGGFPKPLIEERVDLAEAYVAVQTLPATEYAVEVPTYVYNAEVENFLPPYVPVLVRECDGLRIVLGSHNFGAEVPDIQLERRPGQWVLFIHPVAGSDACGYFHMFDDGRTFYAHENPYGGQERTEIIEFGQPCPQPELPHA